MSLTRLAIQARHGKNLHQSDVEAELLSLGEPRGNLLMWRRETQWLPIMVPGEVCHW
jgi:hypothetical protein